MSADPNAASPASAPSLDDRPRRSSRAEGEGTADDYFVLDLDSGRYFALGEVGGFVWRRLDGRRSLGEIAAEMVESFEVTREEAAADVVEFAHRLGERGLLAPR